ncbi:invasion associated locus B family protein [Limimaricola litoreus]|uniref:Invasion associated locus B family protein n=1 Tax=Limimaricola litoreus TaxID=2955316 RepID=A0A9X2FMP9_9RHOB|nr:invasion associated locus B family protein [Limimaricola litoreus]MCP1167426.1 invasion associated locus B family protein [Limimaricola litoreus]
MMSRLFRAIGTLSAGAVITAAATSAAAQEASNRVAAETDWSVFQETDPVECFGVSAPKSQLNTKGGQPVTVNRGETLLFVFYRPAQGVNGQVTFTGGYPFASGSTVTLEVGGSDYQLFTEGDWAWPATPQDDAEIVAAMKRGAEAVLTGMSGRGTQTKDTFSLLGFTAAVEEASKRCAS